MSKPKEKGSFLAKHFPKLFSHFNESEVDQAKLAEFETEASEAIAAGIEAGLENPETLEEPDTEASEDEDPAKLKAEVERLKGVNATLQTQNAKYKQTHKQQAAAGLALPNEDTSVRGQQEQPAFAANTPMGMALKHWQKNHK